jgi:hypothetical protein
LLHTLRLGAETWTLKGTGHCYDGTAGLIRVQQLCSVTWTGSEVHTTKKVKDRLTFPVWLAATLKLPLTIFGWGVLTTLRAPQAGC